MAGWRIMSSLPPLTDTLTSINSFMSLVITSLRSTATTPAVDVVILFVLSTGIDESGFC